MNKLLNILYRIQTDVVPQLPDSVPTPKEELAMLKSMPIDEFLNRLVSGIVTLAINLAIAILVFYTGKFVIRKIHNVVATILLRRNVESSLAGFVLSFIRIVLYFILIVTVIGILGIETSSFLALFASAGVAIGMALSGTLQNFAGGVLILLLKPYKVGDYIEAQGYAGTVKQIEIFHTNIVTPDNKSIIIPNGSLSTGSVNNWSREDYRRIDWNIGISYGEKVQDARDAILELFAAEPRIVQSNVDDHRKVMAAVKANNGQPLTAAEEQTAIDAPDGGDADVEPDEKPRGWLRSIFSSGKRKMEKRKLERKADLDALRRKEPVPPTVVLSELADSSVVLKARAWVPTAEYWSVYYSMLEKIYERFSNDDVKCSFPFPQLDVHMIPQPTQPDKKSNAI